MTEGVAVLELRDIRLSVLVKEGRILQHFVDPGAVFELCEPKGKFEASAILGLELDIIWLGCECVGRFLGRFDWDVVGLFHP